MTEPRKLPLVRLSAEFVVILVGVLTALTADRWMTGLDEREREAVYLTQLVDNLVADSVLLAERVESGERRWRLAVGLLEGTVADSVSEPVVFLAALERLGWHNPLEYSRETWDDLVSTGQLALIRDPELRRGLSALYNRIEWLAYIEEDIERQAARYEARSIGIQRPLVRLCVGNALPPGSSVPLITDDDLYALPRALAADQAFASDLGQVAMYSQGQIGLYSEILQQLTTVLSLLRSAL